MASLFKHQKFMCSVRSKQLLVFPYGKRGQSSAALPVAEPKSLDNKEQFLIRNKHAKGRQGPLVREESQREVITHKTKRISCEFDDRTLKGDLFQLKARVLESKKTRREI